MRTSIYTIYVKIPENDRYALIHGYTGAMDIVQPHIVEYLKNCNKGSKLQISDDTRNTLVRRGYLTESTPNEEKNRVKEIAELLHRQIKEKSGKHFHFIPAYDCNFRCVYCYESYLSSNGSRWSKEKMTKEMVDYAYKAIEEMEPDVSRCKSITLYGGEPLLKDYYDIVKYILDKGIKRGHTFGAVTNGYDLETYLDYIGKGKIEFLQITIDGPPDVHNVKRPYYNGKGTFDVIERNISSVLKSDAVISMRINIDKENIHRLPEVLKIIESNGWNTCKNFSAYTSPVNSYEESKCYDDKLCLSRSELMDGMIELNSKNGGMESKISFNSYGVYETMRRLLKNKKVLYPFKPVFCGAHSSMYLFDPKGQIYTCWECVDTTTGKIGEYYPKLSFDSKSKDIWHNRTIVNMPKCSECNYALFCGGGCAALSLQYKGDLYSNYCNEFQKVFQKIVRDVYVETYNVVKQSHDGTRNEC